MIIRIVLSLCILHAYGSVIHNSSRNFINLDTENDQLGIIPNITSDTLTVLQEVGISSFTTGKEKKITAKPSYSSGLKKNNATLVSKLITNTIVVKNNSTNINTNIEQNLAHTDDSKTVTGNVVSSKESSLKIRDTDRKDAPTVSSDGVLDESSKNLSNDDVRKTKEKSFITSNDPKLLTSSSDAKPEEISGNNGNGNETLKTNNNVSSKTTTAAIGDDKKVEDDKTKTDTSSSNSTFNQPASSSPTTAAVLKPKPLSSTTTKQSISVETNQGEGNSDIFIDGMKPPPLSNTKITTNNVVKSEETSNILPKPPPVNSNTYSDIDNRGSVGEDILPMVETDATNDKDSHFFAYFASLCIIVALCYFLYHNKNRILGLLLEGRRDRSSGGSRRGSSGLPMRRRGGGGGATKYQPLHNNLDEVLTDGERQSTLDRIY